MAIEISPQEYASKEKQLATIATAYLAISAVMGAASVYGVFTRRPGVAVVGLAGGGAAFYLRTRVQKQRGDLARAAGVVSPVGPFSNVRPGSSSSGCIDWNLLDELPVSFAPDFSNVVGRSS